MCLFESMKLNKSFDGLVSDAGHSFAHTEKTASKTMAGILATARASTKFIDSKPMKHCLSRSGFSLSELKASPQGVSVYLSLPQSRMTTQFPWLRMMAALVVEEIQKSLVAPACGHPLLMVLNEFAGLGRMKTMENAVAQIAGYGAKMMFVVQSLAQFKEIYRDNWETFMAACSTKVFFGVDDHFTRDYVSKLVGDHEVIRTNRSIADTSGSSVSKAKGHTSTFTEGSNSGQGSSASFGQQPGTSYSSNRGSSSSLAESRTSTLTHAENSGRTQTLGDTTHKRSLLNPDEVGLLFSNRTDPWALVLMSGYQPLAVRRTPYFNDPVFAGCYDLHPTHPLTPTLKERALAREQQRLRAEREAKEAARVAEKNRVALEQARKLAAITQAREAEVSRAREWDEALRAERERKRERRWQIFLYSVVTIIALIVGIACLYVVIAMFRWFYKDAGGFGVMICAVGLWCAFCGGLYLWEGINDPQ